jgi:hypothetical protein
MESLTFCERIVFPVPHEVNQRTLAFQSKIAFLKKQERLYKKNLKEELKEIVNEFRFGETESRSIFDAFKSLLQEKRRLKPVKSIKKTVLLKRQRKIRFLVSLLKAFDIDFSGTSEETEPDLMKEKVSVFCWIKDRKIFKFFLDFF